MTLSAMRSASALLLLIAASTQARYHGREIGALSQLHHGVRGTVFAVDARTLFVQDFHYDGVGPAAFFYVGTSKTPNAAGATRLRDERGGTGPLRRYRGEGLTISLPDGVTLRDVKWFSVWCDEYSVNFGDVSIPRDLEYPKPAKVAALRGVHGVSSDPVVVVDAQTLLIPNFSYDGEAPDAKFWVGRGDTPSPQGIRIPDENGKEAPLRKYDKKTIVLTLPGELTVFDIGHFAVWCEAFTVNFGHVTLPRAALANVPPSLKMLGVSPQNRNNALAAQSRAPAAPRAPAAHRPRQKIAKVDATTYRPAIALAAGPRAAPDHRPAAHEHLHRRAYTQTLPQEQSVQIQQSQELKYHKYEDDRELQHQNQEDFYQQYQEQEKQNQYRKQEDLYQHQRDQTDNQQHSQDLYRLDQEQQNQNQYKEQGDQYQRQQHQTDKQQYSQDLYRQQQEQQHQNQYKSQEELYRLYEEEKERLNQEIQKLQQLQRQQQSQQNSRYQQQDAFQSQRLRPQDYQDPAQQQSVQYQNEDGRQIQVSRYQSPEFERAQYQRQFYDRQLYEQQRLAYERELVNQRRNEEEPYRYRLLPYSYEGRH